VEAIASLVAASILFFVSNWIIGQIQSARWMSFIKERLRANLSTGRLAAIFGLAFLAVYREAFESVFFFEGLLAGTARPSSVVLGAAIGAVGLAALVVALRRVGSRLPMRSLFGASGSVLYALCVVFAGKGVHALIASGVVAPHPVGAFALPALGVFPDLSTLVAQGALVLAIGVSLVILRLKGDRGEATEAAA
jgi:high-affinity iron transporter